MAAETPKTAAPDAARRRTSTAGSSAARKPPRGLKPVAPARSQPKRLKPGAGIGKHSDRVIVYRPSKGVDKFVSEVAAATPLQLVGIERTGVLGSFIKDLSKRMDLPASRVFTMLGVPKATAEKKAAAGETVSGSGGQAAIGMVRLLGIARSMVENSTASEAKAFDSAKWLGQWLDRPQLALGGRKPADLIDTPTGIEVVSRLLGSIESGAYQ